MNTMSKTWVLYHNSCYDGFGAAWSARVALKNRDPLFVAMDYHSPLPDIQDGDIVYMVDYCRNDPEEMRSLGKRCALVILDHHESAWKAMEVLKDEQTIDFHFNMSRSGARISWEYFNVGIPAPEFIKDIENRDLWLHKDPETARINTRYVHSGLMSYAFDFNVWDSFATAEGYKELVEQGKPVCKYEDNLIDLMCKQARLMEVGGYQVPVVNATTLFSDVAHELLHKYPEACFAAYRMYLGDGMVRIGMRGRGDFDVSKVAQLYGGGGHLSAAAFVMPEGKELEQALIIGLLSSPAA